MLDFDAWQRCEIVKHLIQWALPDPGTLLDVGGYPGRLNQLLPDYDWVICDPLVDAPGKQMKGSASALPVQDQAFDMAVSLDVMEHIPPDQRPQVIVEMIRVSRMGLILTFPHRTEWVIAAEKQVRETYAHLHQKEHPWLSEHALYPLPDTDEMVQQLQSFGGQVAVFDLGSISRWAYLQLLDVLLESLPGSLELANRVNAFYRDHLFVHDFHTPAYRKVILHLFHVDEPISLSMIDTTPEEQSLSDIDFYQTVAMGLMDLVKKLATAESLEPEIESVSLPVEDKRQSPPKAEGFPAQLPTSKAIEEYISRLELGLQHWETAYTTALHDMTDAHRWRNNLEQRRSFRFYKRFMRLLGRQVDS